MGGIWEIGDGGHRGSNVARMVAQTKKGFQALGGHLRRL